MTYPAPMVQAAGDHRPEAARWAARLLANAPPLSPAEAAALRDWCAADPAHPRALEQYSALWEDPAFLQAARAAAPAPRPARRRILAGAGASALGLAGLGWLGRAPLQRALADVATGPGEIRALPPLPGGARLLLDTASAIDLPASGDVRLLAGALRLELPAQAAPLRLEGRWAGWRIAPGSLLALQQRGAADRLALLRGQAAIPGGPVLNPGQGLSWRASGPTPAQPLTLAETDRVEGFAEAWRLFEAAPLAEVAEELARYRPGLLLVAGDVAGLRVHGRYRFARPEEALALLARSLPIRLARLGPLVTRIAAA